MKYRLRGNFSTDAGDCLEDILTNRGVTDIDNFMHPTKECELDYSNLDNIKEGVKMLLDHINKASEIFVVVDSDVDGITSASIIINYIKRIDFNANIEYGVHDGKRHGLEDIMDITNGKNYDLIIVPDAGSNDIEYMKELDEMGVDVLVIDHHICEYEGYDCIPSNTILINNQQSKNYANKYLCGAGVVYKFCEALDFETGLNAAFDYIDLVALGEIADVMSKTDTETNYLMTAGLKNIKNECFKTLLEEQSYSLKEKAIDPYYGLTTTDIGFFIAPLLNAIVRVGTVEENASVVEAFINPRKKVQSTKRGSFEGETETICQQVARLGSNSRSKQNRIKDKAIELVDYNIQKNGLSNDNIIVVKLNHDDYDFPNSMTGLIAANIVSRYHRPVLMGWECDDGMLKGSIRGNNSFEALPDLKSYLLDTGYFKYVQGHNNAAGFSLPLADIDNVVDYANKNLDDKAFDNCYDVDYVIDANDSNLANLAFAISKNERFFGGGIDDVKFVIKNLPIKEKFIMGREQSSVKIPFNGIDYVKFKDFDFIDKLNFTDSKKIDVLCSFSLNTYAGNVSLQAIIEDYDFVEEKLEDKYAF